MPSNKEGMIQEYTTLRSEIIENFNQRTSRLNIVWASVSALVAAGAISKIPEFGCLALLVVSSGWIDDTNRGGAMIKIGSYIKTFLEPNIEGAHWESVNYQIRSKIEPSFIRRLTREIFSTYGIFSIICIIATIIFIVEFPIVSTFRFYLLIGLSVVSVIYWLVAFRRAVTKNPRRVWDRIYKEILEEMTKKSSKSKLS